MKGQLRIARPFGVEVGVHVSWFVIAGLILISLAAHFRALHPGWGEATLWVSSALTAVLFFVSIVLHELSHALVARSMGLPVRSITLFALGGVARMERDSPDPRTEFWMSIAGPLASVAIGASCLGLAAALGGAPAGEPHTPAPAVLAWLGYINVSLALFNLLPAFPMDGGRVLRALLWRARRDAAWATLWSARAGQLLAIAFIVVGVLGFFAGERLGGLWFAFIGWFLLVAAGASQGRLELSERLRGVKVRDVMRRDCERVEGRMSLAELVERHAPRGFGACFVVTEQGLAAGLLGLDEIEQVPRARWPYTTLDEVMQPLMRLRTVSPAAPLSESIELLERDGVERLPVTEGGRLLGVVSRGAVVHFLDAREERGP